MSIKVAIIEDDFIVRSHLAEIIQESGLCSLEGSAQDRKSFDKLIRETTADVYLVDMRLPDIDGVEIISTILKNNTKAKCVALSAIGDLNHIRACFRSGANGYILKSDMPENIVAKIKEVWRGDYLASTSILKTLLAPILGIRPIEKNADPGLVDKLTPRELEVLELLQSSHSVKNIAKHLYISRFTANQHIRKIYYKLQVHSRLEAINQARKNGLLQ